MLRPSEDELERGATVLGGRYQIEYVLGRGGVATVYKATRVAGIPVALKVLAEDRLQDPAYVDRLRTEARLGAALMDLPGLVHPVDQGEIPELGDRPFIAFEFVDARNLNCGALPQEEACRIAREVADVLAGLHARKVVHRDVKPENVLVDEHGGRVCVIDLGFAFSEGDAWIPATSDLTQAHQRPGTLVYMAPEQWLGARPTPRFDVYALGLTLWKLLMGSPPFDESDHKELILRKTMDECPPLTWLQMRQVDPGVSALLGRVLARDPEKRPSAAEFRDELDRILQRLRQGAGAEASVDASKTSADVATRGVERTGDARRRRSLVAVPALAIVAAFGLGIAGLGFARCPGNDGAPPAEAAVLAAPHEIEAPSTRPTAAAAEVRPSSAVAIPSSEAEEPKPVSQADHDASSSESTGASADAATDRDVEATRKHPVRKHDASLRNADCDENRAIAQSLLRQRDWNALLETTARGRCWSATERKQLRLEALVNLGRYDDCIAETGKSSDVASTRMRSRCERLRGHGG